VQVLVVALVLQEVVAVLEHQELDLILLAMQVKAE
jgi:hypothetical protein